jgi:hypothetical protein
VAAWARTPRILGVTRELSAADLQNAGSWDPGLRPESALLHQTEHAARVMAEDIFDLGV